MGFSLGKEVRHGRRGLKDWQKAEHVSGLKIQTQAEGEEGVVREQDAGISDFSCRADAGDAKIHGVTLSR